MMFFPKNRSTAKSIKRFLSSFILLLFFFNTIIPPQLAQAQFEGVALPKVGSMVNKSISFEPSIVKGITIDPTNPLAFDFIVDTGDNRIAGEELKSEATKMIKYFLASLTVPEKDLWVNLSPYEKGRIIANEFGQTEMGRDLLAQDYILKQLTASLIYPESDLGKEFWTKVRNKVQAQFGTTDLPVNTFNKVWIVPSKAVVYEHGQSAFVVESHLKVMLEEDYLSMQKNAVILTQNEVKGKDLKKDSSSLKIVPQNDTNKIGSQIIRDVLIPQIEEEVNTGKNFANLRQIYNSMILAVWYKKNLRDSLLGKVYMDQNKVKGTEYTNSVILSAAKDLKKDSSSLKSIPQNDVEAIYQQYIHSFKKGAYNYIKEEMDPVTKQVMPRKYFSGGAVGVKDSTLVTINTQFLLSSKQLQAIPSGDSAMKVAVVLGENPDQAMAILNGIRENLGHSLAIIGFNLAILLGITATNNTNRLNEERLSSALIQIDRAIPQIEVSIKSLRETVPVAQKVLPNPTILQLENVLNAEVKLKIDVENLRNRIAELLKSYHDSKREGSLNLGDIRRSLENLNQQLTVLGIEPIILPDSDAAMNVKEFLRTPLAAIIITMSVSATLLWGMSRYVTHSNNVDLKNYKDELRISASDFSVKVEKWRSKVQEIESKIVPTFENLEQLNEQKRLISQAEEVINAAKGVVVEFDFSEKYNLLDSYLHSDLRDHVNDFLKLLNKFRKDLEKSAKELGLDAAMASNEKKLVHDEMLPIKLGSGEILDVTFKAGETTIVVEFTRTKDGIKYQRRGGSATTIKLRKDYYYQNGNKEKVIEISLAEDKDGFSITNTGNVIDLSWGEPTVGIADSAMIADLVFRKDAKLGSLNQEYADILPPKVIQFLQKYGPSKTEKVHQLTDSRLVRKADLLKRKVAPTVLPETNPDGTDYYVPGMKVSVKDANAGRFEGAPVPKIFRRSGITLTGPGTRVDGTREQKLRSLAYQLLSGAENLLIDGEDSLGYLDEMNLDNHRNIKLAISKDPIFMKVVEQVAKEMIAKGKRPVDWNWRKLIDENYTTRIYRVRGLHLDDRNIKYITSEGKEMYLSGAMVDAILFIVNNYEALLDQGAPIALYLPKTQTAEEAAFWAQFLDELEADLEYKGTKLKDIVQEDGKTGGLIKVIPLIEDVNAALQLMPIRAAFGRHIIRFNVARWDYIATVIKAMIFDPTWVPDDFPKLNMEYPFMATLEDAVWRAGNTPDLNGNTISVEGGMDVQNTTISELDLAKIDADLRAAYPDPKERAAKVAEKVDQLVASFKAITTKNKTREAKAGYSVAWVFHPDLVETAAAPFKAIFGDEEPGKAPTIGQKVNPNGKQWTLLNYTPETSQAFFALAAPEVRELTVEGLEDDASVYMQYKNNALTGRGAANIKPGRFFYNNPDKPFLMEDRATDEGRGAGFRTKLEAAKFALSMKQSIERATFTKDNPEYGVKKGDMLTRELAQQIIDKQFRILYDAPNKLVFDDSKETTLRISKMALEKFVFSDVNLPWSVDLESVVLGIKDPVEAERKMDEYIDNFRKSGEKVRVVEPEFIRGDVVPVSSIHLEDQQDILTQGIVTLGLNSRINKALSSQGIKTIGDLTSKTELELMEMEGILTDSVNEIIESLKAKGLKLKSVSDGAMSVGQQEAIKEDRYGGINLDPALLNLQIKRDGRGVPLPLSKQPIANMKIDGFMPIIIKITPVENMAGLLGFAPPVKEKQKTQYGFNFRSNLAKEPEQLSLLK